MTREFAALSGRATKLLLELALQYNGSNNGDLDLTRTRLRHRGFNSTDQLIKARNELLETGWIMVTRQGGRNIPSLYAITWRPIDRCGGKLDINHGLTPPHLWKPENARFREQRTAKSLDRPADQAAPHDGATLNRNAEQANQD